MERSFQRLGMLPYLLLGAGLAAIGLLALNHVINNFWPIDVTRLDLIRSATEDQVAATTLLQASEPVAIMAFLAALLTMIAGIFMPLAYFLNERFGQASGSSFFVVLRQAMWVGLWVAFCAWLQMNRTLGWGIALLMAVVFIIVEVLLQLRDRAAELAT
ncbi:MAG: hypothetical protein R3300_19305 [Candidatus Promineifilaceae bacterium]|nr:hypothetical protein [Candidatus Promineifilaceae bacterium]